MDERFPTRRHRADCPLLQSFDIIVLAIGLFVIHVPFIMIVQPSLSWRT